VWSRMRRGRLYEEDSMTKLWIASDLHRGWSIMRPRAFFVPEPSV
jgi:hypothetical protein